MDCWTIQLPNIWESVRLDRKRLEIRRITGTIEAGLVNLEGLDLFAAIDLLERGSTVPLFQNGNLDQIDIPSFVAYYSNEDDDDEWDVEENPIRNIFELIEDVA